MIYSKRFKKLVLKVLFLKETIMFKKTVLTSVATAALISTAVYGTPKADEEFEAVWENPSYTQAKLPDVDINHVIKNYYTTSQPVHFTRTMLWELERKKAWDPKTYIPHVVNDGESWGRVELDSGNEQLFRWSMQRQWKTSEYGQVIENVYLFNQAQKAIFFGLSDVQGKDGTAIHTMNAQPLFHVEHGVAGTEENPLNTWRIVHLTQGKDNDLIERFKAYRDATTLPKYVEVYIEKDLGITIKKNSQF